MAVSIAVARVGTPADFAVLSAAIVALAALTTVFRASLGNAVALSARKGSPSIRFTAGYSSGLIVCSAPILSTFVLGVAWVSSGSAAVKLAAAMAIATPLVLVQDVLRYQASSMGRAAWALASDTLWLAAAAIGILVGGDRHGPNSALLVVSTWATGAALALALLATALRTGPRIVGLGAWLRSHAHFLGSAIGGASATSAANVARVSMIGSAQGPVAVASLAGGQLLMTPMNFLAALIPFTATPVIARSGRPAHATMAYATVAFASTLSAMAWWGVCNSVPDSLGVHILGGIWQPAIELLTPMTLLSIGVLVATAGMSLLLLKGWHKAYATVALITALLNLLGTGAVLLIGGSVQQLAWTQSGVVLFGAALSWTAASRATAPALDPAET